MLILEDLSAEIPDTNSYHWKMKELSEDDGERVLMYGYNSSANAKFHQQCENYKTRAFFNNWSPCEFAQHQDHNGRSSTTYDRDFNFIYSICPHSVAWLNSLNLGREYKEIFYPYNKDIVPDEEEKIYDVIYHGGIHGKEHIECLEAMSKHNYQYLTMTHNINQTTMNYMWFSTQRDLEFKEKIKEVAKSKISVCYNIAHVFPHHIPIIKSQPHWEQNEAFTSIDKASAVMPQFKTRMHEAAISKTLNLVFRDEWHIADRCYKPGEDFIYFDNARDLAQKMKDVIGDWENYAPMVESAYQKAKQYTTDKFVEQIRSQIETK